MFSLALWGCLRVENSPNKEKPPLSNTDLQRYAEYAAYAADKSLGWDHADVVTLLRLISELKDFRREREEGNQGENDLQGLVGDPLDSEGRGIYRNNDQWGNAKE
jgi:hypothetical protein